MAINWQLELPEIIAEVEALSLLIRETDSSLLAFALYRSVAEREAAVRALKERLTLPVVKFILSAHRRNPISLLHTLSAKDRVCVFFYDVEEALPELAGYVNLQREEFAEVPHAVIFWVREHGMREIATSAPDFWSWHSGVFDFRFEQSIQPITLTQTILAEPLVFHDRGDLERRISLYQGLIREHSQQEKPDERFLAALQVKLGSAFYLLGRFEEAENYLRKALERSHRVRDKKTEAVALQILGVLAQKQWRSSEAVQLSQQSLKTFEEHGDKRGIAGTLNNLAIIHHDQGNYNEAVRLYQQSLKISEELGDKRGIAGTLNNLARLHQNQGNYNEATRLYQQSLKIKEELGAKREIAGTLHNLAIIHQVQGNYSEAVRLYQQSLKTFEELEDKSGIAGTLHNLATIHQAQGNYSEAARLHQQSLKLKEELRDKNGIADTFWELGRLFHAQGQMKDALGYFLKAFTIYEKLISPYREIMKQWIDKVRQQVGEEQFESWMSELSTAVSAEVSKWFESK